MGESALCGGLCVPKKQWSQRDLAGSSAVGDVAHMATKEVAGLPAHHIPGKML
jgi:hypothetical protein